MCSQQITPDIWTRVLTGINLQYEYCDLTRVKASESSLHSRVRVSLIKRLSLYGNYFNLWVHASTTVE
jgi:hypothetical protein